VHFRDRAVPGPALSSYDVNAAFMTFQPRESGIHAVWSDADGASVTEVRFRCAATGGQRDGSPFPVRASSGGDARADHDQLKAN
jgi:hypothetical protein